RDVFELAEGLAGHVQGGQARAFGFDQQTKIEQVFELLAAQLRSGAIANEMRLMDQSFAFEPRKRLAHRRLRHIQVARDDVDGDACARSDGQRHEIFIDAVIDTIYHTGRAYGRAMLSFSLQWHGVGKLRKLALTWANSGK